MWYPFRIYWRVFAVIYWDNRVEIELSKPVISCQYVDYKIV
jgi:hypothetical protein